VLAIKTEAKNGSVKDRFCIGESWRAIVEFEVTTKLPHFIAALGLCSVEGVPITTWWAEPLDLNPGRYYVEFPCDIRLSAMSVNFAIGLSSQERNLYYVEGVNGVTISEIAIGEQPLRSSGTGLLVSLNRPCILQLT
jgi:hypothetical protein